MNYDIVILGSGESGTGAALLAHQQGLKTFVSDGGIIPAQYKTELEKALAEAVNNEDYETAAKVRDELNRRS